MSRTYRKEWEEGPLFSQWLSVCPTSDAKAYCKICLVDLGPKRHLLKRHGEGQKHMKNMDGLANEKENVENKVLLKRRYEDSCNIENGINNVNYENEYSDTPCPLKQIRIDNNDINNNEVHNHEVHEAQPDHNENSQKRLYKYNPEWEILFNWLKPAPNNSHVIKWGVAIYPDG